MLFEPPLEPTSDDPRKRAPISPCLYRGIEPYPRDHHPANRFCCGLRMHRRSEVDEMLRVHAAAIAGTPVQGLARLAVWRPPRGDGIAVGVQTLRANWASYDFFFVQSCSDRREMATSSGIRGHREWTPF